MRAPRTIALVIAGLAMTACGTGPDDSAAAPDVGYALPGEENRGGEAFEDNPKDSAGVRDADPRKLADDIGCTGFEPIFDAGVGEVSGRCTLQGSPLLLLTFADQAAQRAYLETHDGEGVFVVDDYWAVRAPTVPVARQVQQRIGGEVAE